MTPIQSRRLVLRLVLLLPCAAVVWLVLVALRPPLRIIHLCDSYDRREGALSANVSVALRPLVFSPEYRLNGGPWKRMDRQSPRSVPPLASLELTLAELRAGPNRLELRHRDWLGRWQQQDAELAYDPSPIELPVQVDWKGASLDVQDGWWSSLEVDGEWRVRPEPGNEGYDRILLVKGAIEGGRRVETEVTYRSSVAVSMIGERGFGVLALWGGHPDEPDWTGGLRRGWRFAMSWYWSKPGGVGNEISERVAKDRARWVNSYRDYDIAPGTTHHILVETQPAYDADGDFMGWRLRSKWWPVDGTEPEEWIETWDREGSPLPDMGYGVALLALLCQVEYGPVRITALPSLVLPGPGR